MKITNRILGAYTLIAISLLAGMAYANYTIPYCTLSQASESALKFASIALVFAAVTPLLLLVDSPGESERKYISLIFILFICSTPTLWSTYVRIQSSEIQYSEFNGEITNKFISNVHASNALTIGSTNYEFIPTHIWQMVQIGDTIIKNSCNETITINGKHVRFSD